MLLGARGDVRLLRTLLDAGGNPNGLDFEGVPIIFQVLDSSYSNMMVSNYSGGDFRDRLRLLLDRGADVNSRRTRGGDLTLLQALVLLGGSQPVAYADALNLLERGADFSKAQDRWILGNILTAHRRERSDKGKAVPPEYEKLCDWLRQHGAILGEG